MFLVKTMSKETFKYMGVTPDNLKVGEEYYSTAGISVIHKFICRGFIKNELGDYYVVHSGGSTKGSICFPASKVDEYKEYLRLKKIRLLKEKVIPDAEQRLARHKKQLEEFENGTKESIEINDCTDFDCEVNEEDYKMFGGLIK